MSIVAVILAAGEGKRMKSDLPKVLHEAVGVTLVEHVGRAARSAGADRIIAIIGNQAELVRERLAHTGWEFAEQKKREGTADAVKCAVPALEGVTGDVLVLAGDVPVLQGSTLKTLMEKHAAEKSAATVLTARLPDPTGYGRILRDASGEFLGIIEHKDASEEQRAVDEVNSSIYAFRSDALLSALPRITNDNAQGEYYLTDALGILREDGERVIAVHAASPDEILGVNDRDQLAQVDAILRERGAGSASGSV